MAIDYEWRLKALMAGRGMFQAKELGPQLEARGIRLSDSQVFRLVAQKPERLNVRLLLALCDILDCDMPDLIERVEVAAEPKPKRAVGAGLPSDIVPIRARVTRGSNGKGTRPLR